jgi:uncharacterized protein YjbI with pentapeptide repeats
MNIKELQRKLIKMMNDEEEEIANQGRVLFKGVNFPKLFSTPISWNYLKTGKAPDEGIGDDQLGWWLDNQGYMGLHFYWSNFDQANLESSSFSFPRWKERREGTTNSYFDHVSFFQANLKGADFQGAWIQNVCFKEANIEGANFTGAMIENCNFHNAKGIPIGWRSPFGKHFNQTNRIRNEYSNPTETS